MKLISAELENYCQFKHLTMTFAPGLTAICGRNGGGKSNAIKGVYATVTGDFGRNDGLKTDNISQFAANDASSKLNVVVEHSGTYLDITRGLRPNSTKLKIKSSDGYESKITKAQEANDAIIDILGVSPRILADYVFVDQWTIFDFLSMAPAERSKAFQRLFRTEKAEALWKLLGDEHEQVIIPQLGSDKDALQAKWRQKKVKAEQLDTYIKTIDIQLSKLANIEHDTIKLFERKLYLSKECEQARRQLIKLDEEISLLHEKIITASEDEQTLDSFVKRARASYIQATQQLSNWLPYEQLANTKSRLELDIASIDKQLSTPIPIIAVPDDYVEPEVKSPNSQFWQNYRHVNYVVDCASHFIDLLKSNVPCCPTCGTPRAALEEHRQKYVQVIEDARSQLSACYQTIKRSQTYDQEIKKLNDWRINLLNTKEDLDYQLRQLPLLPKLTKSKLELQQEITYYENTENYLQQLRFDLTNFRSVYQTNKGIYSQIDKDYQLKLTELLKIEVTKEDADEAQQTIKKKQQLLHDQLVLQTDLVHLQDRIEDDWQAIKKIEDDEQTYARLSKWKDHCLNIRHVLHRDNLPRIAAINYLELMQDEINNLLVRFDSPFRVTTDSNLSFISSFKDGRKVPAARLSGGEKVLLALAFRVVVNDIFAKDLGLLILDEPTAGLDEGNLTCLRIAIERLKELSSSRGLQVIIITHEKELYNLFDHVIEIG